MLLAVGLLAPLLAHKRLHALAGAVTLLADKVGYGLGGSTNGGVFGHGGDCATNMTIDSNRGLIIVLMVQHAGFPKDGNKSLAAFQKAARERFGSSGKEVALFGKNRCNQSCEGLNSANSSTPMPQGASLWEKSVDKRPHRRGDSSCLPTNSLHK